MPYDPFQLESGLIGNVDVTITDAVFTHRPDSFDHGQTLELHLTMQPEGEEEVVQFFRCGDGWETNDKGRTAEREDGTDRNFHANTKVGELFKGLVNLMAEDREADKAIRERVKEFPLGPRDADFWKGLKVHLTRETRKGGGEIGDYEVLVIDGFNGIEGGSGGGGGRAGGAKKAAAPAKKATKKASGAGPAKKAGGLTDDIRAKLDVIADESADHDSFMERAFAEIPEASTDDDVKAAIGQDESVEGSIWADAIARYEAQQGEE